MFLVEAGHASTRSQAQRLIASGVEWRLTPLAPWKKVAKNGDDIPVGAELQLLDAAEAKYISRGGLKLEGALAATGIAVRGCAAWMWVRAPAVSPTACCRPVRPRSSASTWAMLSCTSA